MKSQDQGTSKAPTKTTGMATAMLAQFKAQKQVSAEKTTSVVFTSPTKKTALSLESTPKPQKVDSGGSLLVRLQLQEEALNTQTAQLKAQAEQLQKYEELFKELDIKLSNQGEAFGAQKKEMENKQSELENQLAQQKEGVSAIEKKVSEQQNTLNANQQELERKLTQQKEELAATINEKVSAQQEAAEKNQHTLEEKLAQQKEELVGTIDSKVSEKTEQLTQAVAGVTEQLSGVSKATQKVVTQIATVIEEQVDLAVNVVAATAAVMQISEELGYTDIGITEEQKEELISEQLAEKMGNYAESFVGITFLEDQVVHILSKIVSSEDPEVTIETQAHNVNTTGENSHTEDGF